MMFADVRDPDGIRAVYAERGLPVMMIGPRPHLVTGGRFGLVAMPNRLGHRVIDALPVCGPVLGQPRSRRLAFVVASPAPDPPLALLHLLGLHAVVVVAPGRCVALPCHDGAGRSVLWVNEPRRDAAAPREAVIIDVALRLAQG
ncbi:hypothetical protein B7C42_00848 [Nocardia cerradoensis]|uniref:Uncharacterized protein n=1 Tax=Nocardia cerradoensis TaxID=85688 RepID=A0A231HFG9_9NOCA|nr:hypothetical protein [Nocardia cerradoensis]OXR47723.1 hypothetical protein B7C42_00848 [Nocardia cerradoensis]